MLNVLHMDSDFNLSLSMQKLKQTLDIMQCRMQGDTNHLSYTDIMEKITSMGTKRVSNNFVKKTSLNPVFRRGIKEGLYTCSPPCLYGSKDNNDVHRNKEMIEREDCKYKLKQFPDCRKYSCKCTVPHQSTESMTKNSIKQNCMCTVPHQSTESMTEYCVEQNCMCTIPHQSTGSMTKNSIKQNCMCTVPHQSTESMTEYCVEQNCMRTIPHQSTGSMTEHCVEQNYVCTIPHLSTGFMPENQVEQKCRCTISHQCKGLCETYAPPNVYSSKTDSEIHEVVEDVDSFDSDIRTESIYHTIPSVEVNKIPPKLNRNTKTTSSHYVNVNNNDLNLNDYNKESDYSYATYYYDKRRDLDTSVLLNLALNQHHGNKAIISLCTCLKAPSEDAIYLDVTTKRFYLNMESPCRNFGSLKEWWQKKK